MGFVQRAHSRVTPRDSSRKPKSASTVFGVAHISYSELDTRRRYRLVTVSASAKQGVPQKTGQFFLAGDRSKPVHVLLESFLSDGVILTNMSAKLIVKYQEQYQ